MKKILLGSSAIVGLAFAGAAQAQDPIQLGISGNLETALAFSAAGGDNVQGFGAQAFANQDSIAVSQDYDITFTGNTTLENGLTVGVYIQFDNRGSATTGSNPSGLKEDEIYAVISGGFGEFRIGQDDEVLNDVNESTVTTGGSLFYDGVGSNEITFDETAEITDVDVELAGNNAQIWYRTPRFAGFRGSVSYAPENTAPGDQATQGNSTTTDIWSFALEYDNSFGAIDLGVFGGYSMADGEGGVADEYAYGAGAKIGFAGFQLGGAVVGGRNAGGIAGTTATTTNEQTYHVGLSYSIDKVSVGVMGAVGSQNSAGQEDSGYSIQLDGSYAMGPGITFGAGVAWSDFEYNGVAGGTVGGDQELRGIGVGTSLKVSF